MNDKYEQLKSVIQAANSEIMRLPQYPYNPDAAKAVVELQKLANLKTWDMPLQKTASSMIQNYEEQRRGDYIAMLEQRYPGRPIRLADVLLAIRNNIGTLSVNSHGVFEKWERILGVGNDYTLVEVGPVWNLKDDNLDHQTEETKQFLIELLTSN